MKERKTKYAAVLGKLQNGKRCGHHHLLALYLHRDYQGLNAEVS